MWYWYLYGLLAICVAYDAAKRRAMSIAWAMGTFICGPMVLPVYLAKRPLMCGEVRLGGSSWNMLRNFALCWSLPMILLAFAVAEFFVEADGLLETYNPSANRLIGVALGIGLMGIPWALPSVSAMLLGRYLKDPSAVERDTPRRLD